MTTTTALKTVFAKDERTENWLRSHGVIFTGPVAIKLTDIDRKVSRNNQARDKALIEDAVDSYRQALRNGQALPAIVVHKVGAKYVIVDGNNRDQAANEEKALKAMAYVLDPATPSETITLLTVTANTTNGVRVDKSWSLHNALYLTELGWTKDKAARALNVSVAAISAHEKERNTGKRAVDLRITGWNTMPVRVRQMLGRIKLDKPFVIVAEAAIVTKIGSSTELNETITKINHATTEEEAIEIASQWARATIENAKQNARMGKKHGKTDNPKLSLMTGLGKVSAFNLGIFNATFSTDEDRRIIKERLDTTLEKLLQMRFRLVGKDETEEQVLTLLDNIGNEG